MKLQTSFFNRAWFVSNIRRHGVFSILFFIISAAISNVGIMANTVRRYSESSYSIIEEMFSTPWDIAMLVIVPVLFALVLFRFLMEEKALSTIHAMPISRNSLYATQWITFEVLFGLPVLVNGIIAAMILASKGYPINEVSVYVASSILLQILGGSMVFGFTVLIGVIVGSSVLQAAIAYIIMGAPFIIVELSRVLLVWLLSGFPKGSSVFAPHYYLTPYYSLVTMFRHDGDEPMRYLISLAVVIVYFLSTFGISWLLYIRRDLERHTDLIVFDRAKTVLSVLLTVIVTLSMSSLIGAMMNEEKGGIYIGIVLGSLIGFVVTKMIAAKTIAILGYWRQGIAVIASFILVILIVDLDLAGYEGRIPNAENVDSVLYLEHSWLRDFSDKSIEEALNTDRMTGAVLAEERSISEVRSLHEHMIEGDAINYGNYKAITLVYYLKDGSKVHRVYNMTMDHAWIGAVHELPEFKENYLERFENKLLDPMLKDVKIQTAGGKSYLVKKSDLPGLLQAYRSDVMQKSYLEEYRGDNFGVIEVGVPQKDRHGNIDDGFVSYGYYNLSPSFENCKQWLRQHGMEEGLPDVTRIESYQISRENMYYSTTDYNEKVARIESHSSYGTEPRKDPAEIRELFALGYDYSRPEAQGYTITYFMKNGGVYRVRIVDLPYHYQEYVQ